MLNFNFVPIAQVSNKLSFLVKKGKDITKKLEKTNVVYKLQCNKCKSSYVGETMRALGKRVKEHQNDVKKKKFEKVVPNHCRNEHNMNWNRVKILDNETNRNKRLLSEMINIHLQDSPINAKDDTLSLPRAYIPIINNLVHFD